MASVTVGKLNAVLTAVTAPFTQGLGVARTATQKFKGDLEGVGNSFALGIGPGPRIVRNLGESLLYGGNAAKELHTRIDSVGQAVEAALGPGVQREIANLAIGMGLYQVAIEGASKAMAAFGVVKEAVLTFTGAGKVASGLVKLIEWFGKLALKVAAVGTVIVAGKVAWDAFAEAEELAANNAKLMDDAVADFRAEEAQLAAAWDNEIKLLAQLRQKYLDLIETPLQKFQKQQEEINNLLEAGFLNAEEYAKALDAITDAYNKASGALDEWNAAQREAERIFEQTRTPLENYEKTIQRLNELFEKGFIDQDTLDRALRAAREELEKLTKVPMPELAKPAEPGKFEETRLSHIALDAISPQQNILLDTNKRMAALLQKIEENQHNLPVMLQFN